MTPTFKDEKGYKFSIFSNEEIRIHVHVYKGSKSAKVWLEPKIELAENKGFKEAELNRIMQMVIENEEEFKTKYRVHIR
jgi:hypothetical protein